jgi:cell division protein FtsI (penicillin-binding protein 3)
MLLDRNGEPLAVSTPVDSVWAHPGLVVESGESLKPLAKALETDLRGLRQLIKRKAGREFVYLRRHLEPDMAERLKQLAFPGVYLRREYRRYYPAGEVTAHLVGFTDIDDRGIEGMELVYDEWMAGSPGSKRVIKDRLGRTVEDVESISIPAPGKSLTLSIDRRLQYLAYRELKAAVIKHRARSGSMVLLDVTTGEVLALVNQPSFNPNDRGSMRPARSRNRAVTDLIEPGSTIKPLVVANALSEGVYQPQSIIDTRPGYLRVSRQLTVRDFRNYGVIDVATVLKKSSNVGVTKIAMASSPEKLWDLFTRLGFGTYPGTGFPGESSGTLTHFRRWGPVERATIAYGYGLAVTPLQLAEAYATIAGYGIRRPSTLLKRDKAVTQDRVMSERVASDVIRMMEGVTAADGTAHRARIPGYRVAGKTGTSRKLGDTGYDDDRYLSIFAGMVPATKPRFAAVVVINEPTGDDYYGGVVAAPVFSNVLAGALRMMDVPPDDPESLRSAVVMQEVRDDGA